jgi:hypothetical protein
MSDNTKQGVVYSEGKSVFHMAIQDSLLVVSYLGRE